MPQTTDTFDLLPLSEMQRRHLVDRLEQLEVCESQQPTRRVYREIIAAGLTCTLSYDDKISRDVWFRVVPRSVSDHGVEVLHGAFAYIGTPARVRFHRASGDHITVHGSIQSCAYISGKTHNIAVAFDEPVLCDALLGLLDED